MSSPGDKATCSLSIQLRPGRKKSFKKDSTFIKRLQNIRGMERKMQGLNNNNMALVIQVKEGKHGSVILPALVGR